MTLLLEQGLLFAHTPKTAGTSFRMSLVDCLGKDRVICDYNQGNKTTSQLVEEHYYLPRDSCHFGEKLSEFQQRFCVLGHFAVQRHSAFFPARNVLIFFREPLQQILSNYGQRRRVNGFSGGLEDFCKVPAHRDVQAKTLGAFPLHLVGYIGLQEHYVESLQAINDLYDLSVQERVANASTERQATDVAYDCSAEELILIKEYNQRDFALYEKAKLLFMQRREIEREGQCFVHGCITVQTKNKIEGWAMQYHDNKPVELTISVNTETVSRVRARDFRVALRGWNASRQGFVGFSHLFKQPLAEGDLVECRVSDTGQLLFKG